MGATLSATFSGLGKERTILLGQSPSPELSRGEPLKIPIPLHYDPKTAGWPSLLTG
jgi:hypothetical protein